MSVVVSQDDIRFITVFEDHIYWTSCRSNSIYRANKTDGTNQKQLIKLDDTLYDIDMYHPYRQPEGLYNLLYTTLIITLQYMLFYYFDLFNILFDLLWKLVLKHPVCCCCSYSLHAINGRIQSLTPNCEFVDHQFCYCKNTEAECKVNVKHLVGRYRGYSLYN